MKKRAFTLAEVLITLGVIGVVAALTLPAVIHNYRKKVIETKMVQTVSMINQAIKMGELEYGIIDNETNVTGKVFSDNYLLPYLKNIKLVRASTAKIEIYFTNGVFISTNIYGGHNFSRIGILKIDLGVTNKNRPGIDEFSFTVLNNNNKTWVSSTRSYALQQVCKTDRTTVLNNCKNHDDNGWGYGDIYCAALIECNGWKIPKDYPIKY